MEKIYFGTDKNGNEIYKYTIFDEKGNSLSVLNYGATIQSLIVTDKNGVKKDVVLGFDNLPQYEDNTDRTYFGAVCGRVGNRIAKGEFYIEGEKYTLAINNGPNCLHGGAEGWQYQVYEAELLDPQTLQLTINDPDGHMGFPGNVTAVVTYKLTDDNAIDITYSGTADKPTVLSMTNHAYFNLSGNHGVEGTDMVLYVNADTFTPADAKLIPTGEMRPVEGTPFDFRTPKAIGQDINQDDEQLVLGNGYDHNWVLDRQSENDVELAASVYEPASGRYMEVWTDQPALQFYGGNFFDGSTTGKYGRALAYRESIALETQKYPDTPNHPHFPSTLLNPGENYTHVCIYKFSVR